MTLKQRRVLESLHRGFLSSSMLGSVPSLIKRGMVEDLGLYDRVRKQKRYGANRYRVTPLGRKEIREGRV